MILKPKNNNMLEINEELEESQRDSVLRPSVTEDPLSASHQYKLRLDRETELKQVGVHGYFNLLRYERKNNDYVIPDEMTNVSYLKALYLYRSLNDSKTQKPISIWAH